MSETTVLWSVCLNTVNRAGLIPVELISCGWMRLLCCLLTESYLHVCNKWIGNEILWENNL